MQLPAPYFGVEWGDCDIATRGILQCPKTGSKSLSFLPDRGVL